MNVTVGIDLAQSRDFTAICLVEAGEREVAFRCTDPGWHAHGGHDDACRPIFEDIFTVRELGRLPQGVTYPKQAEKIVHVLARLNERKRVPWVRLDATGVGAPVADDLSARIHAANLRCRLTRITITGGDDWDQRLGSKASIPKFWLISRLQTLFESERIRLPSSRQAKVLRKEIADFRPERTPTGLMTFEAKTGAHDDLIIALALAVAVDPSRHRTTAGPSIWV